MLKCNTNRISKNEKYFRSNKVFVDYKKGGDSSRDLVLVATDAIQLASNRDQRIYDKRIMTVCTPTANTDVDIDKRIFLTR